MPYKRTYARRRRARPFVRKAKYGRKAYRGRKKYISVKRSVRQGQLIADKQYLKLKYNSQFQFSGGSVGSYVYAGNAPYDPNVTGVGGQPQGFDQWNGFYTKYRVKASKIKLIFVEGGAGAGALRQYSVMPVTAAQQTTITSQNPLVVSMQPKSRTTFSNVNVGAGAITQLRHYAKSKDIFGVSSATIQDEEYAALFTANPLSQWNWVIVNRALDNSSGPTVYVQVQLTYYLEVFSRISLGPS